ncbi:MULTISPECIES: macro domain-containing protein [unclassified Arthrobacter]|uniref:macro domain-containing protein n=1 Tax=unclassified Arthrobacter TaxID=235627 RepID=UPI00159DFA78|nr:MULTISPECIES: macro domain-containing protein [unclassified Arthrobacter]MCQ9163134.1 macro domain-containing protein [Arthrobacter sp. STN4]NVM99681.1 O-acetyl-ADP-ribose deacetylase [Arthrobacter sp. SDTb3-6]
MDITVVQTDITTLDVDAIVNAANPGLLGGGGVDGAIHRAAGAELLAECRELRRTRYPGGLPVGDAVATGAGLLPARWVIHTVGPNRYAGQVDRTLLESCFSRCCEVAAEIGARTMAFPAIGGGVYGWSATDVAAAAMAGLAAAGHAARVRGGPQLPEAVVLVAFSPAMARAFREAAG